MMMQRLLVLVKRMLLRVSRGKNVLVVILGGRRSRLFHGISGGKRRNGKTTQCSTCHRHSSRSTSSSSSGTFSAHANSRHTSGSPGRRSDAEYATASALSTVGARLRRGAHVGASDWRGWRSLTGSLEADRSVLLLVVIYIRFQVSDLVVVVRVELMVRLVLGM